MIFFSPVNGFNFPLCQFWGITPDTAHLIRKWPATDCQDYKYWDILVLAGVPRTQQINSLLSKDQSIKLLSQVIPRATVQFNTIRKYSKLLQNKLEMFKPRGMFIENYSRYTFEWLDLILMFIWTESNNSILRWLKVAGCRYAQQELIFVKLLNVSCRSAVCRNPGVSLN